MIAAIACIAASCLMFFIAVFFWAIIIRNNSIVDIAWGIGFVLIAFLARTYEETTPARFFILLLVTVWGLRLGFHIYLRNYGKGEDFRYRKWREEWGNFWVVRSFLQIFLLQWVLMQLVAIPIYLGVLSDPRPLGFLGILGVIVWGLGFFFEAIGDLQLLIFKMKKSSHGKLMTTGLWRFTRHPNYFGEATLWWGIALIAYSQSGNLFSFVGPVTIDFLLLFVSGIPLLEKKYQGQADWKKYAKVTSPFFPLPPKLAK